ncbi:hypothetical protein JMM59_12610 [Rhodovulum sulfidophilum]|nr:hypothetical protein [Rhodovulum sulfidophilum]
MNDIDMGTSPGHPKFPPIGLRCAWPCWFFLASSDASSDLDFPFTPRFSGACLEHSANYTWVDRCTLSCLVGLKYPMNVLLSAIGSNLDISGNIWLNVRLRDRRAAQLYAGQGRPIARVWIKEWAADPKRFQSALNAYTSSLRGAFFGRYAADAEQGDRDMCDRVQDGLKVVLGPVLAISAKQHTVLMTATTQEEKKAAAELYSAAERVIHHAMMQLYFGAGARAEDKEEGLGLNNPDTKSRFLADYAEILELFRRSREPRTLHYLIELYEHLMPGDPIAVTSRVIVDPLPEEFGPLTLPVLEGVDGCSGPQG